MYSKRFAERFALLTVKVNLMLGAVQVLEYCEHHRGQTRTQIPEQSPPRFASDDWDKEFIQTETDLLFKVIVAANFLDIKPLLLVFLYVIRRGH